VDEHAGKEDDVKKVYEAIESVIEAEWHDAVCTPPVQRTL